MSTNHYSDEQNNIENKKRNRSMRHFTNNSDDEIVSAHQEKIEERWRKFLSDYAPEYQTKVANNPRRCICGNFPTVAQLAESEKGKYAYRWFKTNFDDLAKFSDCSEINESALKEFIRIFVASYGRYRMTEVMLFFHRFKKGLYGKLYGRIDPTQIFMALREYNEERSKILYEVRLEEERAQREREEEEYEAMRRSFRERVPDAHEDDCLLTFLQYNLLELYKLSDEELEDLLDNIRRGVVTYPTHWMELCELRRELGLSKQQN